MFMASAVAAFFSRIRLARVRLSSRISLLTIMIVLITAVTITLIALEVVKNNTRNQIHAELAQRLEDAALGIDFKFDSRSNLLKSFSESLGPTLFSRNAALQAHLMRHRALKEVFDTIAILDSEGTIVANYNDAKLVGVSLADRPYFRTTLAIQAPAISKPILNRFTGKPQVMLTQPVFDEIGVLAYVIIGAVDLHVPKFLGQYANMRFGQSGFLFIANSDGLIVQYPDKEQILAPVAVIGDRNIGVDLVMNRFYESGVVVHHETRDGLYSYKRIRATDWVLGAYYPKDEAFRSVAEIEKKTLLSIVVLALLAGIIAARVMRGQLAPLLALHRTMELARNDEAASTITVRYRNDEIGDLGQTFAALMRARRESEGRLRHSEQYLRSILAHAGDAFVSCDWKGRITEWNRQAEETFGWLRDEVIARSLTTVLFPPETRASPELPPELLCFIGTHSGVHGRVEALALHR